MLKKISTQKLNKIRARERISKKVAEHKFFDVCAADPGYLARGLARAAASLTAKRAKWLKLKNSTVSK